MRMETMVNESGLGNVSVIFVLPTARRQLSPRISGGYESFRVMTNSLTN